MLSSAASELSGVEPRSMRMEENASAHWLGPSNEFAHDHLLAKIVLTATWSLSLFSFHKHLQFLDHSSDFCKEDTLCITSHQFHQITLLCQKTFLSIQGDHLAARIPCILQIQSLHGHGSTSFSISTKYKQNQTNYS